MNASSVITCDWISFNTTGEMQSHAFIWLFLAALVFRQKLPCMTHLMYLYGLFQMLYFLPMQWLVRPSLLSGAHLRSHCNHVETLYPYHCRIWFEKLNHPTSDQPRCILMPSVIGTYVIGSLWKVSVAPIYHPSLNCFHKSVSPQLYSIFFFKNAVDLNIPFTGTKNPKSVPAWQCTKRGP